MANASFVSLLPRLFISMAVVILVMWVAARALRNRRLPGAGLTLGGRNTCDITVEVVARQGVGKNAALTVVRAGHKTLVLGVTERQVTLLTELEINLTDVDVDLGVSAIRNTEPLRTGVPGSSASADLDPAWKGLLAQVRERTVRRS